MLEARFTKKFVVNPQTGCWEWIAYKTKKGYGLYHVSGTGKRSTMTGAHRYAYIHMRGTIPVDKEVDHLCRVRHCVNPDHLEVVPHKVNVLRGENVTAHNARKTCCPTCGGAFRKRKDGRVCPKCAYDKSFAWQKENPEQTKAWKKAYRHTDAGRAKIRKQDREYKRAYRKANPEKMREYDKLRYAREKAKKAGTA